MSKNFHQISLPCIMGILNITPDSFSDGGKFFGEDSSSESRDPCYSKAEQRLYQMVQEGAAIVDIGGESTRPSADAIDSVTEWSRIEKVLKSAVQIGTVAISVDTYHPDVAELALVQGANIINDICCTHQFPKMARVVKDFDAHLIAVHNGRGREDFLLKEDPVAEIILEFEKIFNQAIDIGFDVDRIILDPGIGFGKTAEQNLRIFKDIHRLCERFKNPVICAISKKSFLKNIVDPDGPMALSAATTAGTTEGYRQGCKIFRVHDIPENLAALQFAQQTCLIH
jgi:dihydropteroate synthase